LSEDTNTTEQQQAPHITVDTQKAEQMLSLQPVEGGKALFYATRDAEPEVCTITRVWGPSCVNLDNGKTSVPVFPLLTSSHELPASYYALLFIDEPHERDPVLPETPIAEIKRLELARSLPEVPKDHPVHDVCIVPGCIERFKASETDRRTMEIVGYAGGLAVRAVD
jgi:hypothetical protein